MVGEVIVLRAFRVDCHAHTYFLTPRPLGAKPRTSCTISGLHRFRNGQAAQTKLGDLGFLSRDITVRDLLLNRSDVHHVYPRNYLKKQGLARGRYNQIANFVLAQS